MKTNFKHTFSFNAFQIKMIALITMTLDHISSYQTITKIGQLTMDWESLVELLHHCFYLW